jgi:hypothetical protein
MYFIAYAATVWSLERRQEFFDCAKAVIDQQRGVHPTLENVFDTAYTKRLKLIVRKTA